MNNKIKQMVYAALLTSLAIIIPIQFGFLKVVIPPFTATLASHVPMMLAMLISPAVSIVVGIGSALGFLISGMPMVVVFRAATHILVGYVGAKVMIKSRNYMKATIITAPIHGIAEMVVVIPFIGFDLFQLLIVTAVGTIIHHFIDGAIAYSLAKAMSKARKTDIYHVFGEFCEDKDVQAQI
ncbi:ECF transporter S component [Clostridium botulinum]|uniref:ECF transporter S component n=1 Tax=Clostridium botulinum TaxID=1491 RepID=UPI0014016531|nr:ECF transporter S component [Clostridium botulinum]MBN1042975.1 ECF transporter S component [Clostridium botulinum]NFI54134.1 ECF transporter S component [Clostridium botulinum]